MPVNEQSNRSTPALTPHAFDAVIVATALNVDPLRGLTTGEVNSRREQYGANALQTILPRPAWRILLDQFASLVIALLAVAAGVAWATGDHLEGIAILVVLLINAVVGFATEWQAGRALDALRRQAQTISRVRRDGVEKNIDAEELVPGDIVVLNAGDRIPADARLLEAARLQVEESALTGESATVVKGVEAVAADTSLTERRSMLYLGTGIASGHALALVVSTGQQTELGRIGHLVATSPKERSPLEQRLSDLGRRLVYIVLIIAALVMVTGWLRGDGLWMMVEVGISLAVAAVPEALPAVTTLILALGVMRMARQRAIIRRLTAVETLGSTTVICTDKTGTLTENCMTVREYHLSDGRAIHLAEERAGLDGDELLERAVRIGVLCNEASFNANAKDETRTIGDPTETALLVVAEALGFDVAGERNAHPKLAEQPFQTTTRRMTTLHRTIGGEQLAALKGAPAVVLEACATYAGESNQEQPLDEERRARFIAANEQMAERALRVLALAAKQIDDGAGEASEEALESGYTFLGFVGMIDPPRPEVGEAIRRAALAGIRTVMLTGDQLNTARAIARELGIGGSGEPSALHARDLLGANHQQIAEMARTTDVFARVSPEDKLHIVEALQASGEVVAVTGDGVNDAPALKRANIGIAMGQRGTEVAKEAADVVLADDNFATIVRAVEGGRTIYANITKFVHLMFSKNLGEVLTIFPAIAIGWPLPLLPLQILWINLVTDIFPGLALALEPTAPGVMQHGPQSQRSGFLSRPFLVLIGWQGAMLAAINLSAYAWALSRYGAGAHARTIALLVLVSGQLGHLFNCRSRTHSAIEGVTRNPYIWMAAGSMIVLQTLAVYFTPLARVLDLVPPNAVDGVVIAIAAVVPIVIVEATKAFARRGRGQRPN